MEEKTTAKPWLKTILVTFVVLRLTILVFFRPQGMVNSYTDFYFYYNTASLSEQGYYPFINMWYEYPPLLAYLVQGVYALVRLWLPAGGLDSLTFEAFAIGLGAVLLAVDLANLYLLYRIAVRTWNVERANWLGWVYAALGFPLMVMVYAHQGVPVLFTLLALYALMRGRERASAVWLGLGIAAKLTPAFFLGPAVRWLWPRGRNIVRYILIAAAVAAATYLPFILMGSGKWVAASFRALSKVASYSTLWAALDGNWTTGYYGPLTSRLDITQAGHLPGNPSLIPSWASLALFGAIYAGLFYKPIQTNSKNLVRFTTLSALVFHLWSRGWSPQWALGLIPLILLSFPDYRGLAWVLGLTALAPHSWPFGGALPSVYLVFVGMVGRAVLFCALGWRLFHAIWPNATGKMNVDTVAPG